MSKITHESLSQSEVFLSEIKLRVQHDPLLKELSIRKIKIISGGVSHYVFELILEDRTKLYLKKRADHFAQLPQIKSNPEDIKYEYSILVLFQQLMPKYFPEVLIYSTEGNYIVLTDVMPNESDNKLENMFLEEKVTPQIVEMLGETLSEIHVATKKQKKPIREPNDLQHYELKLLHRLGYRNHPILNWAVTELRKIPNKQIILGDVAPKNIGINNDGESCSFFDMEEAHLGDPLFDYAYLLGHIIVHNLGNKRTLSEQIIAFENAYNNKTFDVKLVRVIALGIVLYRLNSIVPYPLTISTNLKRKFESQIERKVLYQDLSSMSWEEIIESMHK